MYEMLIGIINLPDFGQTNNYALIITKSRLKVKNIFRI